MTRADRNRYHRTNIMAAIVLYKAAHDGNSPTIRYLSEKVNLSSSQIHGHLNDLREMGLIRMTAGRAAAIEVVGGCWSMDWEHGKHKRLEGGDDLGRIPGVAGEQPPDRGRSAPTSSQETIA